MSIVKDRYRGTPVYDVVKSELIAAARYQGLVTYQDLARLMGLPSSGSHMGREVGHVLGEISEDEHEKGRPLLSALAVSVEGIPSMGFYEFAQDLGRLTPGTESGGKHVFWEQERKRLYEIWRKPIRS